MDHSVKPSPDPDAVAQSAEVDRDPSVGSESGARGAHRLGIEPWQREELAHDAAVAGTFAEVLKPQEILTCVEWMRRHHENVSERLWQGVYQIAQHGRSQRTRLIATRILADRIDPIPRELPVERGPVTFNVAIVNADGRTDHAEHQAAPDGRTVRTINRDGERA